MALTELGFERPTYEEILENQINRAKTLFGDTIDTSELTALGKYIRINVADLDTLYQTLEGVYYARFPNTASGVSLDRLCPFAGITRNAATYARHKVTLTGTAGATIEAGFEVSNENQSAVFHLIDDYVIGDSGTVTAYVDCNEAGNVGNITSASINTIVNPSADVESVSGVTLTSAGKNRESDTLLRTRFSQAVSGIGSGTMEAIKGAIMGVNDVDGCTIKENDTDSTVDGIPPHSFECFVLSNDLSVTHSLIGQAIFEKKPLGIKAFGEISVEVADKNGNIHTVSFTKTIRKELYIEINLITNDSFPDNGEDIIKTNLVNFLAAFTNGETVYRSSLYNAINIDGVVSVESLKLSGTESNITCAANEVARVSPNNITIHI